MSRCRGCRVSLPDDTPLCPACIEEQGVRFVAVRVHTGRWDTVRVVRSDERYT
jgi:hypothetical protein